MSEQDIEQTLQRKLSMLTRAMVRGDIDMLTYDELAEKALSWAAEEIAGLRNAEHDPNYDTREEYRMDHARDYRKHER